MAAAIVVGATAVIADTKPFLHFTHTWGFAAATAVVGIGLLALGVSGLPSLRRAERFAALGMLGAALLAAAMFDSAFVVGEPQRVPAVPGQTYHPPHSWGVVLTFPSVDLRRASTSAAAPAVEVSSPGGVRKLQIGRTVRSGPYVFAALENPLAYVSAAAAAGQSATVTQPNGWAFVSQYLVFPSFETQPEDAFAVPALHRAVHVAYYPGLPARGIHIPFLVLQINEENGGMLFRGVAVSGKPVSKGGMRLNFWLATYPAVFMGSAPPALPFFLGIVMLACGLVGYGASVVLEERSGRALP